MSIGSVLVIVPTYNERENLELIAGRLHAAVPEAHLLVVDDNSPDGTGEIADELAAPATGCTCCTAPASRASARPTSPASRWAREHGYDVVVEMDADGSHAPEQLPRLLAALENADLVLGQPLGRGRTDRQLAQQPRAAQPRRQRLHPDGARHALQRRDRRLPRLPPGRARQVLDRPGETAAIASQGYCFQVDLAWQLCKAGRRVVEVPITFVERERGESKMSRAIVVEALWRVTGWGVRHRARRGAQGAEHAAACSLLVLHRGARSLELCVLIQVGQAIGAAADDRCCCWPMPSSATWLLRSEGRKTWQAFRLALVERRLPAVEVADGALVVFGGRAAADARLRHRRARAAVPAAADAGGAAPVADRAGGEAAARGSGRGNGSQALR